MKGQPRDTVSIDQHTENEQKQNIKMCNTISTNIDVKQFLFIISHSYVSHMLVNSCKGLVGDRGKNT